MPVNGRLRWGSGTQVRFDKGGTSTATRARCHDHTHAPTRPKYLLAWVADVVWAKTTEGPTIGQQRGLFNSIKKGRAGSVAYRLNADASLNTDYMPRASKVDVRVHIRVPRRGKRRYA